MRAESLHAPRPSTATMFAVAAVMGGVFLTVVLALWLGKGIPVGDLTRDPAALASGPPWLGFLSTVGLMMWSAAAAVTAASAYRRFQRRAPLREVAFPACAGALSLMLGFDDAFLVHEVIMPMFHVPEPVALGLNAAALLAFLVGFHRQIAETPWPLLVVALGAFAVSVGTDLFAAAPRYFVEDGAKFCGITCWMLYFFFACNAAHGAPSVATTGSAWPMTRHGA